jgi:hypothetical protein
MPGNSISNVEISNISPHGLWLLVDATEFFLPFEEYPWFKDATVSQIGNVQLLHGNHLYWPDIDVDLNLSILLNPVQYPLMAQVKIHDIAVTL